MGKENIEVNIEVVNVMYDIVIINHTIYLKRQIVIFYISVITTFQYID